MKWLLFGIILATGYYYLLTAETNMALQQTMHIADQYKHADQIATQIANASQTSNR